MSKVLRWIVIQYVYRTRHLNNFFSIMSPNHLLLNPYFHHLFIPITCLCSTYRNSYSFQECTALSSEKNIYLPCMNPICPIVNNPLIIAKTDFMSVIYLITLAFFRTSTAITSPFFILSIIYLMVESSSSQNYSPLILFLA